MRTGRPTPPLKITADDRKKLEALARGNDRRVAARAAAILASADGVSNTVVASRHGMTKQTVGKWRTRFLTRGVDSLHGDPRPGAPRRITDEQVARVLQLTAEPAPNGSPWTTRSMAHAVGLTQTAVSRIWRKHGVKPAVRAAGGEGGGHARDGHAAPPPLARPAAPIPPSAGGEEPPARSRVLAAMNDLLRDARALRAISPAELDPLLNMAIDAIERALLMPREPVRSARARAQMALSQARTLLEQAQSVWRSSERLAKSIAAHRDAVAAVVGQADGLRRRAQGSFEPRRCPSCSRPYTLRFTVRGLGGDPVAMRMKCPNLRCGKLIVVRVPRSANEVRLEEATPAERAAGRP